MKSTMKYGLGMGLGLGVTIGLGMAIGHGVWAERGSVQSSSVTLPVEELRTFTEVFAKIKSDYVEPVDDKNTVRKCDSWHAQWTRPPFCLPRP